MEEMRQAIEELKAAENYFNCAKTKDEIDRAIHLVTAAEIKVNMVIKEARGELN